MTGVNNILAKHIIFYIIVLYNNNNCIIYKFYIVSYILLITYISGLIKKIHINPFFEFNLKIENKIEN